MQISKTILSKIDSYVKKFDSVLDKPRKKFVHQMVYGVIKSGSLMLTEIGRQLKDGSAIKSIENRLSRNLKGKFFSREKVRKSHLSSSAKRVKEDTVITFDIADVTKPYAKAFEYQATVRDASKKKKGELDW